VNVSARITFLPNFRRGLFRAAHWRLLLLWLALVAVPSLIMTIPVGRFLSAQLDHTALSQWWSRHWDIVMLADLGEAFGRQSSVFTGSVMVALMSLWLLVPLASSLFTAAWRAALRPRIGELLREALRHYWPMLRLTFMTLIPLAIAAWLIRLGQNALERYRDEAVLPADVDHRRWLLRLAMVLLFLLASSWADAGRASLALNPPERRSAIKAWWRGMKLVFRHPLRSLSLSLGIALLTALMLALLGWLRIELLTDRPLTLLTGFLLTQLSVAVIGWMHFARLFAMAELTTALRSRRYAS
jgi:hypothetical protein